MFLTVSELQQTLTALESARRTFRCPALRVDAEGKTHRPLQVRRGVMEDVAYGAHGYEYMEIDPATQEIRCGACAGTRKGTVTP